MVELFAVGCLAQSPRMVDPRFRVSPHESSPRGHTLNEPVVRPDPRGRICRKQERCDAPTSEHDDLDGEPSKDVRIAPFPEQRYRIEQRDSPPGKQSQAD